MAEKASADMAALKPGAVIGILGGGQLGRMLAMAAARLGYRTVILDPDPHAPAAQCANSHIRAGYDDAEALRELARQCDVITYEFENIPVETAALLSQEKPVFPPVAALENSQDRLAEKQFLNRAGVATAPFFDITDRQGLSSALAQAGGRGILKTRRMGYDGKGQVRITADDEAAAAWASVAEAACILEGLVEFSGEFSVLLARGADGDTRIYDVPHNRHDGGILATSDVPAPVDIAHHAPEAVALARRVAEKLDYVGLLTLEFFATPDGPVFNEMAPRVHNSGHWTIEGARVSQFENHIRAVCGLPLGNPALTAASVRMTNLLGDAVHDWAALLADPNAHLHLYGKSEVKPGRKMGHVTWL